MNTTNTDLSLPDLPITRSLRLVYAVSILLALIMTVASAVGILYASLIYPTDALLQAKVPSDWCNLIFGLPILLGSMWLTRRGMLIGLLCWPGALFYVLYVYLAYLVGVPFNTLFLLYVALVALSAFATIGLVTSIDSEAVRHRLMGAVPERLAGSVLTCLTALFIVRQLVVTLTALIRKMPVDQMEYSLWISDLVLSPAWLIGGYLLWRRRPLGYVAGAGLLLLYSMLFLGLIVHFPTLYTTAQIDVTGMIMILAMSAVTIAPFVLFARGVVRA